MGEEISDGCCVLADTIVDAIVCAKQNGPPLRETIGEVRQLSELNWKDKAKYSVEVQERIDDCIREKSRRLNLSLCELHEVPEVVFSLHWLEVLEIGVNDITVLPAAISGLTHLEFLFIGDNALSSLPDEIGTLQYLLDIDLGSNQFTEIPRVLYRIDSLREITAQHNQISKIHPDITRLTALKILNLADNQLDDLPVELMSLPGLETIYLHHNPALGIPLEVLGRTWSEDFFNEDCRAQKILRYYFDIQGDKGQALREAKLIFVGRGEVGKSSMVDMLTDGVFYEDKVRTDGIDIKQWPVELDDGNATVSIWDFGGQEIMHGTHQFFLTHRSLYVVMVDGRHDCAKQDAEYWLKMVRTFGGNSTVFLVLNRQEKFPFDVDRNFLASKYDIQLNYIFRTDCATGADIDALKTAILTEVTKLLAVEERFPRRCWDVKARLSAMKANQEDYFSDAEYTRICQELGVNDEQEQKKLLQRLADLGSVVSFPDEVKLAELSVLNPEWVTDGIYKVVTDTELRDVKQGQVSMAQLRKLLPKNRWPSMQHVQYILDLMRKFDLCFNLENAEELYLVPELLPDSTPRLDDWQPEKCVIYQFQYTVLPHGILPRFITLSHELSRDGDRWRTGVILRQKDANALVRADYDLKQISVWVNGKYVDAKRSLLALIKHTFERIHQRIPDLKPTELVALKDHPKVLVPFNDLIEDERRGKKFIAVTVDDKRQDRAISEFLDGVVAKKQRDNLKHLHSAEPHNGDLYQVINVDNSTVDKSTTITTGDISHSQVGGVLENCTLTINQLENDQQKQLLSDVQKEVEKLLPLLPEDTAKEVSEDFEKLVEVSTSENPRRRWYDVSAEGLLEASKFTKEFTGNLVGTVTQLGKCLWPDFELKKK